MPDRAERGRAATPAGVRLVGALVWTAVAVQGAVIAGHYYQRSVGSDVLSQYELCRLVAQRDVAQLAAWTNETSTFWFPDYLLLCPLTLATGGRWLALPLYGIVFSLALALLLGLVIRSCGDHDGHDLVWGAGAAAVVLALPLVPGLAPSVAWLVTPFFHGGSLLTGLAIVGLTASTWPTPPTRWRRGALTALVVVGLLSDLLLLVHVVAPLGLALWLTSPERSVRLAWSRVLGGAVAVALVAAVASQLFALASGTFFFSLAHNVPPQLSSTCSLDTAIRFARDLWRGRGFVLMHGAGLGLAAYVVVLTTRPPGPIASERLRLRLLAVLVAGSFVLTAGAIVASCYWWNPDNTRCIPNALVFPVLLLVVVIRHHLRRLSPGPTARRALAGIGCLVLGWLALDAARDLHPRLFERPYPDEVAALDRFLAGRNLVDGLGDYWTTYYFNALARSGARLGALRHPAAPYFWGNTAYAYLEPGGAGRALAVRRFTFVVANGLDRRELDKAFGPPADVQAVGSWHVLVYDQAGQRAMAARVEEAVRARLQGRPTHARWPI